MAVESDDLSICNMSTESLNSETAHVCIDSCDSLEELSSNVANHIGKRKAKPKKVKKRPNNLTLTPINRLPLDVMYGNSLLNDSTEIKQNDSSTDKGTPLFLSVTEMLEFDKITQTPKRATTLEQHDSISRKRSAGLFRDRPVPKEKRKKISNHSLSSQVSLNKFTLEINNLEFNRTPPPSSVHLEMRLHVRKLSLKKPEVKVKKLPLLPFSQTLQFTSNFTRVPVLNLKRIIQLSPI